MPVSRFKSPRSLDRFTWHSFDVRSLLPQFWRSQILDLASSIEIRTIFPTSVTSREGDPNLSISIATADGVTTRERLPWLYDFYRGLFLDLAQQNSLEEVSPAASDLYGLVLNIQRGNHMRYECHVDTNPIQSLLYVTDNPEGTGGELVVANNPSATSIVEVDADCTRIFPVSGHLLFFDARRFPHYVRPLRDKDAIRVVVAMNYYVPSSPENERPADLDAHLFGKAYTAAV
jgi:hypothetical protein